MKYANPHLDFWPKDWLMDEAVAACSFAAQGVWMRLLCRMAIGENFGYLSIGGKPLSIGQICGLIGGSPDVVSPLIEELRAAGVFSENGDGVMYSRRLLRDEKAHRARVKGGKKGGTSSRDNEKGIFASPRGSSEASSDGSSGGSPLPLRTSPNLYDPQNREKHPHPPLIPEGGDGEFEAWWKVYPRKEGKHTARQKFAVAVKKIAGGYPALLDATRRFADASALTEPKFIPHPATWLNQQRWSDYLAAERKAEPDATPAPEFEDMERGQWRARLRHFAETGRWFEDMFGPAPGKPGCKAPPDLVLQLVTPKKAAR